MKTITIRHNELEAVALASSTEATRYYLVGVCFETYGETVGMIATDGHRLHTINAARDKEPDSTFIMATDDIKKAIQLAKAECKTAGKRNADKVSVTITHEGANLIVTVMNEDKECGNFKTREVDGNFPDWRRVCPSGEEATASIGLNPNYVDDFGKAAQLISGARYPQVNLTFSGAGGPMIVTLRDCDKFMGVLMPMRF